MKYVTKTSIVLIVITIVLLVSAFGHTEEISRESAELPKAMPYAQSTKSSEVLTCYTARVNACHSVFNKIIQSKGLPLNLTDLELKMYGNSVLDSCIRIAMDFSRFSCQD